MNPQFEAFQRQICRRTFLGRAGLGAFALDTMLGGNLRGQPPSMGGDAGPWRGVINPRHFAPKAKRVIQLYMAGGISHLESFDYKPKLVALDGQLTPESFTKGQQIAQLQGKELKCLAPQAKFRKHGKSGQEISDFFPHIAACADDMAIIRSMHTEQINHDPAHTFMNTGGSQAGRPSVGSWTLYGLGSDAVDLPGFVVLISTGKGGQMQPIAARQWHSGFLPSKFQGINFRSTGDPVLYVRNPQGVNDSRQRDVVDAVSALNRLNPTAGEDPEIATRIAQYEMAFQMQASVPELMDISKEPRSVLDMYGAKGADGSFNYNCLLARRLAERGCRFIQLYHRDWDHHSEIKKNMEITAPEVDQATAALINDLKQRGMLEDTLIIWNGEFGRTPMAQGAGRDHHIAGFSVWMAGGGVKGGVTHGATDELGYHAVENIVHVRDYHATILNQLGIDHRQMAVKVQGLNIKLTGVEDARVVKEVLA